MRPIARYHFASEELLITSYNYPAETQLREHRKLLAQLDEMLTDPTYSRAQIRLFVYKWLTNHIQVEDAELAKHVLSLRQPFLEPAQATSDAGGGAPKLPIIAVDHG